MIKRLSFKQNLYNQVKNRDGLRCGICKQDLADEWKKLEVWRKENGIHPKTYSRMSINLDLDHVYPKSKLKRLGELSHWWRNLDNLQLTHSSCNRLKSNKVV